MYEVKQEPTLTGLHRIRVVGLGCAGGKVVAAISEAWTETPDLVAINTDAQTLDGLSVPVKLQIGGKITRGGGCGGDVSLGRLSAERDADLLRELFAETDLVILVIGLGGGTGW